MAAHSPGAQHAFVVQVREGQAPSRDECPPGAGENCASLAPQNVDYANVAGLPMARVDFTPADSAEPVGEQLGQPVALGYPLAALFRIVRAPPTGHGVKPAQFDGPCGRERAAIPNRRLARAACAGAKESA
jgi:hypothetical protein